MKISKRILALSVVGTLALSACSSSNENTAADTAPLYVEATAAAAAEGAPAPAPGAAAERDASKASKSDAAAEHDASPVMAFAAETAAAADDFSGAEYYEMPATTAAMMWEAEDHAVEMDGAEAEYEMSDDAAEPTADEEFTSVEVHNNIQAGQLTAGEWNDNENWGFFINLVNSGKIDYPAYGIDPRFRTAVTVKDKNGAPVVNATVSLFDEDRLSWTAVTDKEGVVYLFGRGNILQVSSKGTMRLYKFDNSAAEPAEPVPAETSASVPAEPAVTEHTTFHDRVEIFVRDTTAEVLGDDLAEKIFGPGKQPGSIDPEVSPTMEQVEKELLQAEDSFVSNEVEVVFDGEGAVYPDMQIMFIVDTTGSMGDELMFLQSEFAAIADTVGTEHAEYSVNFYRDHGDKYVTLTNPFSGDIKDINRTLNSQTASGGGDGPEAVSEILDECMHSQEWREDTVKLAFLIFDAPPHDDPESLAVLEKAMKAASSQGIRVIPVVSSNTARETELFGRGLAIFTGGTYVFLTDDSGIGGSHLEPIIGAYKVESLYSLIVRLIEEYRQ